MNPISMDPNLVYNLVASNPGLKSLVEQTARLQQQAQQMAPMLQQVAQNPLGAVNNYVNWQNQQQGGQSMGMFEQAMGIVEEFRKNFEVVNKSFEVMNNNLREVYDLCTANMETVKALNNRLNELSSDGKEPAKSTRQKAGAVSD